MSAKAPAKGKHESRDKDKVFSDAERAAVAETARERKSQARISPAEERAAGEADVQAKFAEMPPAERAIGEKIHQIVASTAPDLVPRTYYGMPAYAKAGKIICFFQPASKFKVRYNTFGFQPDASLDDGELWPIAFAVTELTPSTEARIAELVKRAVS